MKIWAAILLLSVSLIGAPLAMVGANHHDGHSAMTNLADDGGAAHSDHAADQAELDGMCCASGIFSCAAVAVLAMEESLMFPLHFASAHTSVVDDMMIDGLIHTLERPPRLS